jgi:inositol transport system ATP-binding protein
MKGLSIAQTQMVEIAKAISYDSRLIIMDEPTSAIPEREVDHLHRMIKSLRESGVAIIYITHKLEEVFKISDYVTVFRDGRHVSTLPAAELDRQKLVTLMVGRELTHMFPKEDASVGDVALSVRGLTRRGVLEDITFELRRGEILGLAGLMGAGRTEVLEAIFGITPVDAGTIEIDGKGRQIRSPADAIHHGLALLTEDRKRTGIMGVLSVRDNMAIASLPRFSPGGLLRMRQIDKACQAQRQALAIKTPSLHQLIKMLSGGNQQKVLVSRWLLTTPEILMIDEPTRGIDVGAKAEIHRLMSQLAGQGKAILMVSSEMPEILGMSDRVLVMCEGRLTGEFARADATQERIMHAATATAAVA